MNTMMQRKNDLGIMLAGLLALCLICPAASAVTLTWVGDWGTNYWDINTTANWDNGGGPPYVVYNDGDDVTFNDTGSYIPDIDLTAALAPASVTVNSSLGYYYTFSTTGSGYLTGTTGITKNGEGTLTVNTVNDFSGDVVINAGKFVCGHAKALGDSGSLTTTTVAAGATLDENGKNLTYEHIYFAGSGVDGTGAIINNTAAQTTALRNLTLTGDAAVGGAYRMDVKASSPGADTLTGNGHDLTIKMTAAITSTNSYFSINDMAVDNLGNVNIESGTLNLVRSPLGDPTKTVTIASGAQLRVHQIDPAYFAAGSVTKKIVSNGGKILNSDGKNHWYGDVTLNADTEIEIPSGLSLSLYGDISGTGGINQTSSGSLLLMGDCSYSGTTTGRYVSFGRSDTSTGSPGPGNFDITYRLLFRSNQVFDVEGNIGGDSGALSGGGVFYGYSDVSLPDAEVTIKGNNTYTGVTYVYTGAAIVATDTALGTTDNDTRIQSGVHEDDSLPYDGRLVLTNNVTLAEPIRMEMRPVEELALPHLVNQSGSNTLNGPLTIYYESGHAGNYSIVESAGTELGDLLTIGGDLTEDRTAADNTNLVLRGTGNGVLNGNLLNPDTTSTLNLLKDGAGTWTVNGAGHTYNGLTTISGGTLALGASASIASSAGIDVQVDSFFDVTAAGFTLTGSQTLGGAGTVLGNVTTVGNNQILPGDSTGTLTINGNLDLVGGDILQFELSSSPAGDNDLIDIVGGNLTLSTVVQTDVNVTMTEGSLGTGTYTLINYDGTLTGDETDFNLTGVGSGTTRQSFNISTSTPQQVNLVVSGSPLSLTWTGAFNYDWDVVGTYNWDAGGSQQYYELDHVTFNDTGSNASPINLTADVTPGSLTVNNPTKSYTISGVGGITCGTGLTKSGAGNFTVSSSGANAFGDDVTLNGGGLTFSGGNSNAVDGDLLVNGGALTFANSGDNSISGNLVVTDGTLTVAGSGTNTFSGEINLGADGTVIFQRSDDVDVPNLITGVGTLKQEGTGVLTISNVNPDFSGPVYIDSGTLKPVNSRSLGELTSDPDDNGPIVISSGATLDDNGRNLTYRHIMLEGSGVGGAGAIVNNGASQTTALRNLTLTGDATVGGAYRMDVKGSSPGAETITGNGHDLTVKMTAAITGTNSYFSINDMAVDNLGNVIIESGTLNVVRSPLGDPTKTVTISAAGQLKIHQIGPDYSGPGSITKPIVSNGGIISVFDLGGKCFWAGNVTLNADTTVDIDSGESLTLLDPVGGTGGIVKNGGGNFLMTADCTYSGTTTINGGILAFGHSDYQTGSPGTGDFVLEGGKLYFNTDQAITLSNTISGTATGTGIKYGSGEPVPNLVVTITGNNTYDSNTYILHGTVIAKSDTAFGSTVGATYVYSYNSGDNTGILQLDGSTASLNIAENFYTTGSGSTPFRYDGPGVIQNVAGNNTLSGAINLDDGGGPSMIKVHGGSLTLSGTIANSISNDVRAMVFNGGNGTVT
ncbi:MAG: autotransporter-associated beta strand repeat-containing protein, partial [Deltaproteobacteria bacterium]|nr:autotransporter-associated beta strand repeat-containing protein [Candidatus Anaeroferrophillacea bacterium]